MKVSTLVAQFQFAMIGAVVLMSGWSSRAQAQDGHSPSTHQQQGTQKKRDSEFLRIVRASTERFKDVLVADVEGYKLKFGCVSGSDSGAMGMHFVNGPLVDSGVIDVTRPQIVIYEPTPSGRLRLIGADYLVLASVWDAQHTSPPELHGHLFICSRHPIASGFQPSIRCTSGRGKTIPTARS